ncbi:chemotaxis protein CheB [Phormidium tenue FACHB-886]|nr:chemotaxis protein CheB [Phormidium tenue FACHB-886]
MSNRNIIVIGASAGGVEAMLQLVQALPPDLPAAVFVIVHFPSNGTSLLPGILGRAGKLPAVHPQAGDRIQSGTIYIAPPNYHLILRRDWIQLSNGPRENGHRPAIDTLFRSAAKAYGQQVIGVILSGTLDDGAAGLTTIKRYGGIAIVQDPEEALFSGMPRSAIAAVGVDHVLPLAKIAEALVERSQEQVTGEIAMSNPESPDANSETKQDGLAEAEIVQRDKQALEQGERSGQPSMLTCPDCGGVLWELGDRTLLRYRCHVGHAYSADTLFEEQGEAVEVALWTALRALEEKAALTRRMAHQSRDQQRFRSAARFLEQADEITTQAETIRQVIYKTEREITARLQSQQEAGNGGSG